MFTHFVTFVLPNSNFAENTRLAWLEERAAVADSVLGFEPSLLISFLVTRRTYSHRIKSG